jgi:hypothetical protein
MNTAKNKHLLAASFACALTLATNAARAADPVNANSTQGGGLTLQFPPRDAGPAMMPVRTSLDPRAMGVLEAPRLTLDATTAPAPASVADDQANLARKLANPISSLISVPFQYNADFNGGVSGHAHRSYLNIQPVIPISLNDEWNLISRTIVPVMYQEAMVPGQGDNFGLGDTTASFFFSPKEPTNGWIWGVGPVAYLATATDTALGAGRWGGGITGVALKQEHGWTYGMLANHIWAGPGDSDNPSINSTFLQPFLSYTFPTATTLTINTESTYDWRSSQWTIPVNVLVAQVVKVGGMPMQFQLGPRYYAEGPSTAPEWGLRFSITLLFPK